MHFFRKTSLFILFKTIHPDASARYHATQRSYRYIITRKKDPLLVGLAWYFSGRWICQPWTAQPRCCWHARLCMFQQSENQESLLCITKKSARWKQKGDLLLFEVSANRFSWDGARHNGTLIDVGSGKNLEAILKSKDPKGHGTFPAEGLYLIDVKVSGNQYFNLNQQTAVERQQESE